MASQNPDHSDALAALRALGYNRVPKAKGTGRGRAQPINQVLNAAPSLAQLTALARDNQERLRLIGPLLPSSLRACVQSGGLEGDSWCLLVPNSAAAAKLRQTLPALCAHLRRHGWAIQTIRVKVQSVR